MKLMSKTKKQSRKIKEINQRRRRRTTTTTTNSNCHQALVQI
jgi:hypothetical protein